MNIQYLQRRTRISIGIALLAIGIGIPNLLPAQTASNNASNRSVPTRRLMAPAPKPQVKLPKAEPAKAARQDYFISPDTVIIGCTSGMAAGILVGSVPVAGAMMTGIGVPESITLLVNLTGMGCGVGAVSSAVAIFTAWMLDSH